MNLFYLEASLSHERVIDDHLPDSLSVLQVFIVQGRTTGLECGSDAERILKAVLVAGLDFKAAWIKLGGPV